MSRKKVVKDAKMDTSSLIRIFRITELLNKNGDKYE